MQHYRFPLILLSLAVTSSTASILGNLLGGLGPLGVGGGGPQGNYYQQPGYGGYPNYQNQPGAANFPNMNPNYVMNQPNGNYNPNYGVNPNYGANPNYGGANPNYGDNPNYGAYPNNQYGANNLNGNVNPANGWGNFPAQGGIQGQPVIPANPPQNIPPQQPVGAPGALGNVNSDIDKVFNKPGEQKGPVVFETSTDNGIQVSEVPEECKQGGDPKCLPPASTVSPLYLSGANPVGNGGSTILNGGNQFGGVGNPGNGAGYPLTNGGGVFNNGYPFNNGGLGNGVGFPQGSMNGGYPATNGAPFTSSTGGLGTPMGGSPFADGGLAPNAGAANVQPAAGGGGENAPFSSAPVTPSALLATAAS